MAEPPAKRRARAGPTTEPTYPKPDISVEAIGIYYRIVAPLMLPFLDGRLLNLFRCSEGRCLFQRNRNHPPAGDIFQPPIRLAPVEQKNGRTEEYLYVTDLAGILACADVATVEFHGWGSRAGAVETPDRLVIDLDPDPELGFETVKAAAFQLRRSFDAIGLTSFPLLSGGKGIHVVVPIAPEQAWPAVRDFAKRFCAALAEAAPDRFTIELPKERRKGRIFLDFLRNQRTATAILPYSARAKDGAPVAAPVGWAELEHVAAADTFGIADAEILIRRSKQPLLAGWGEGRQHLPTLT